MQDLRRDAPISMTTLGTLIGVHIERFGSLLVVFDGGGRLIATAVQGEQGSFDVELIGDVA